MVNSKPTPFWSPVWKSMVLSSVLLVHIIPLYANGSSFISNSTHTNSSELKGVGHKTSLPGKATPISLGQVHSRKPRAGEESGSGGESGTTPSVGSSGREQMMDLTGGGMAAKLPTMAESQIRLDFNEEAIEDSAPRWKSERLQADGTLLDLKQTQQVTDLFSYETTPSQPEEIITVNFYNPPPHHHVGDDPPAWVQELQGGDPTSWTLSDFYDYLSPELSPTDVYPDESQPTPLDMDENGSDPAGSPTNSDCLVGFLRINGTCVSPCEVYTSYCFNGGQCFVVDGIGAFCRCNVQEFIWNKGSRCESVITDFQVMCIAVGGTAIMLLVLFMVVVFFSKKLYLLKTENKRLRKRSKCRPPSEQPVDNFSLSTVAENSQANVRKLCASPTNIPYARALAYYDNIVCQKTMSRYTWEYKPKEDCGCEDDPAKEEPVKCPPEEDELLNNQNSLTPKLENNKAASEDNAEEGGVTIDLELLLPKEAKMHSETSPPLHYNVFLYKLPKSPKKSPVMRRPPGRSGQGRPLSQLCPRRSSEPGYSPISTRSLPGVLSGSSSPRLGAAYTP